MLLCSRALNGATLSIVPAFTIVDGMGRQVTRYTLVFIITPGIFAPLLVVVKRIAYVFIKVLGGYCAPTDSPHLPIKPSA